MTHLEKKNLKRYKIAIDLLWRSIKSKDLKGRDDSVEYGNEKYGLNAQSVYLYRRATKFLYLDSYTCMLTNKYSITQLAELSILWLETVKELHEKNIISHDLTCLELREIAKLYKHKEKQTKI